MIDRFALTGRLLRVFAGATAVMALVVAPAGASTARHANYVALGDSYTAAPLVLTSPEGNPLGCARSTNNYPNLVAKAIKAKSFDDVSCSSATTDDMYSPQSVYGNQENPPQLDAVNADTTLVTVGIGGNDVGLVGIAETCGEIDYRYPHGTRCKQHYQQSGRTIQERIADTAPKIAALIQAIHAKAPLAKVVIVGYPDAVPPSGKGCYPLLPISQEDIQWFDSAMRRMNAMLRQQAIANGAKYADVYTPSLGHDTCKLPGVKWLEGLIPTSPAFIGHPNAMGERNMARQVLRIVDPFDQISPPSPLNAVEPVPIG
jgi:lysophospholipase L1-like esterase